MDNHEIEKIETGEEIVQEISIRSEKNNKRRNWRRVLMSMAAVVVFCTTYALILPALTADNKAVCGIEEHVHEDACYTDGVLTCDKEEHTHCDTCYADENEVTAAEPVANGSAVFSGQVDNITWRLEPNSTGGYTLYLEGTGAIPTDFMNRLPEDVRVDYIESINELTICSGITEISDSTFIRCPFVTVNIPATVEKLGFNAFEDNASLKTVNFAENSQLNYFGDRAFSGCYSLSSINLENCTAPVVEFVGNSTPDQEPGYYFRGCESLKEITLPAGACGTWQRMFYCTGIEAVHFQPSTDAAKAYSNGYVDAEHMFSGCGNLKTITGLEDSLFEIGNFSYFSFYCCSSLEKIDYRKPISDYYYSTTNGCSSLTSIEPILGNSKSTLETIYGGAFMGCNSLTEVDLSEYTELTLIESAFLECQSLKRVVLPINLETLGASAFANCNALEEVVINCKDLSVCGNAFDNVYSDFTLKLGKDIDKLSLEVLRAAAGHCGDVIFEGPNYFSVDDETGKTGLPAPLNNLNGDYYVDEQGVLYSLDKSSHTAQVVYCPPGLSNCIIPAKLEHEGILGDLGLGEFNVTSVGPNAFALADSLKSVTFEDASQVKLCDFAFAKCASLKAIKDGESGKTAKTIADARKLFKDGSPEYAFYLVGMPLGEGETEPLAPNFSNFLDGGQAVEGIKYSSITDNVTDQSYSLSIATSINDPQVPFDSDTNTRRALTGESVNVIVSFSIPTADNIGAIDYSNLAYRVYFALDNPDWRSDISEAPACYGDNGEWTVICKQTDTEGIYYLEITPTPGMEVAGSTASIKYTLYYPSPSSGGGEARVWGMTLTSEENDKLGNKAVFKENQDDYLRITWATKRDDFGISKAPNGSPQLRGGSKNYPEDYGSLRNLSYIINVSRRNEVVDEAFGKNYIKRIDFTDTPTLPTGVTWRPEVIDAVRNEKLAFASTTNSCTLYALAPGERIPIATISGFDNNIASVSAEVKDDNVIMHWRILNKSSDAEIDINKLTITYGDDVFLVQLTGDDRYDADEIENTEDNKTYNHVDARISYAYDPTYLDPDYRDSDTWDEESGKSLETNLWDPVVRTADAENIIPGGEGYFTFEKVALNDVSDAYRGDPANFRLTVTNPTPFSYNDLISVYDHFPSSIYISADEMQRLFTDADNYGRQLEITIANACLCPVVSDTTVTCVNGRTTAVTGIENTGTNTAHWRPNPPDSGCCTHTNQSTIVIKWESPTSSRLKIVCSTDGADNVIYCSPEGLGNALDSLGYHVTANDIYTPKWTFSDSQDDVFRLSSEQKIVFNIYSHFKNTFQTLGKDEPHNGSDDSGINVAYAQYYEDEGIGVKTTEKVPTYATHDLTFEQIVKLNGKNLDSSTEESVKVAVGDVLDYREKITHYGDGTYDVLPVVSDLMGAQVLLVPVSQNHAAEWAEGCEIYTDETGIQYYMLCNEGTYNGVWIGTNYADRVVVAKNGSQGLETKVYWYYTNLPEGTFQRFVDYKAIISPADAGYLGNSFSFETTAFLNDHQTHRLYCSLGGGGTSTSFGKGIVDNRGDNADPTDDVINPDGYTLINDGEKVCYRLLISNSGSGRLTITGKDFYDELPKGYDVPWVKGENIKLEYVTVGDVKMSLLDNNGNVVQSDITDPEWYLSSDPAGDEVCESGESYAQQYIQWDDNLLVEFDSENSMINSELYIYVTVDYPSGDLWQTYVETAKSTSITNTFIVYDMPATVAHGLVTKGCARLQKGVHSINSMNYDFGRNPDWFTWNVQVDYANSKDTGSRTVFSDPSSRIDYITYYVTLYNDGNNKLYINPLQDLLPKGFEFACVQQNEASTDRWRGSTGWKCNSGGDGLAKIEDSDSAVKYMSTNVIASETRNPDGTANIVFTVDNTGCSDATLKYDDLVGKYYLDTNEALVFGYSCYIGLDSVSDLVNDFAPFVETAKYADNVIAMEYYDYMGTGFDISRANSTSTGIGEKNDGGCSTDMSAADAADKGFSSNVAGCTWLSSDVEVRKGDIVPGTTKSVEKDIYYEATTGEAKTDEYSGVISPTHVAEWKMQAHNNGGNSLTDYTLVDTMQFPYVFTGDVYLDIYESGIRTLYGHKYYSEEENIPIFTIDRSRDDDSSVVITSNLETTYTIPIGTEADHEVVTVTSGFFTDNSWEGNVYQLEYGVSIYRNESGAECLELTFEDVHFGIPPKGRVELIASTFNPTPNKLCSVFYNEILLVPNSQEYNEYYIQQGNNVKKDGKNYGVHNESTITVASGYATQSFKSVYEIANEENKAVSSRSEEWILLPSAASEFTYSLDITGVQEKPMDSLVLIDTLPYPGDHVSFSQSVMRNSEFTVHFASNPNFIVTFKEKDETGDVVERVLDSSEYSLEFSSKTEFEEKDWKGTSSWSNSINSDTKSFRIIFDKTVLPKGAQINVKFNAVVADDAEPGLTAWNSFGYAYSVESTFLEAAPLKVGVRIPSAPILGKEIVLDKEPCIISKSASFGFIVYTGEPIAQLKDLSTEAEIAQILADENRSVTYQEVTVNAGTSGTPEVILKDKYICNYDSTNGWQPTSEKFTWADGQVYSVLELPINSDSYKRITIQGSFQYNPNSKPRIIMQNEFVDWNILLLKVDARNQAINLEDAKFGLYSPNEADAMTPDDISEFDLDERPKATITDGETTYYLSEISSTNENGIIRWQGLLETRYLVLELQAPDGYFDANFEPITVERSDATGESMTAEITVTNDSSYELPKSGGMGTLPIISTGMALMLGATLVYIKTRRNRKEDKTT